MNILYFLLLALLFSGYNAAAQYPVNASQCAYAKKMHGFRTTIADPAEENYDVKYLKFNINLTNTSTTISGDVTTKALTVVPSFSAYVFELDSVMTIDSVLINGVLSPFVTTGYTRIVSLATPLPLSALFTAQVFYHGTPVTGPGLFGTNGMNNIYDPTWRAWVTYSAGEAYHAKEWWPCKQSLQDKIDSVDMWVTIPNTLKVGSNGILKAVTTISPSHVRYEWKEKYPIDYYLISVAIGPYSDYSYHMHFTGSTDSMLIQNYIYNHPGALAAYKSQIDSVGLMIDFFSSLFGRYPFWEEKYGHSMAWAQGMENQTMTTINSFNLETISHELGHQWFGDNVTCATWSDIMINEGFATYASYLHYDHFADHATAVAYLKYYQDKVKTFDTGVCYVDDTVNEPRIFDSRLTFGKSACILHMLRSIVNNDSTYFQIYKKLQQVYGGSNATTIDLKNTTVSIIGAVANGINIDTFFNQWAYLEGFPIYTIRWNQAGSDVWVQIDQRTAVPSSVPIFSLPVELLFKSMAGNVSVRVNNDLASQLYHFTSANVIDSIILDPNFWLVYKLDSIVHDTHLAVNQIVPNNINVYPNPTSTEWNIEGIPANSELLLSDMTGRVFWQHTTQQAAATIPANSIAPGMYFLRVVGEGISTESYKLIKL